MMNIKFIRGTIHLGYAHRAGDTANYPDEVAKRFVESGYAVENETRKRKAGEQKQVKTTQQTRSKKRPVKK